MPRALPVTGWPPSRPSSASAQEWPFSRRSSLEPAKITVKSAPACGLRVLRMALRAPLDCDLGAACDRACWKDGPERASQLLLRRVPGPSCAGAGRFPERVTAWWCGASALLLGAQQREGVLDALVEDLIGELPVGQGAGELQRPDHQGEDAERLRACRLRVIRR
jgi:hypothetical protein